MKHRKTNRKARSKNKKRRASRGKYLAGAAAAGLLGAGAAQGAMIYDEQQQQPGGDFAGDFNGRASVPISQYDTVKGQLTNGDSDYFMWTGFSSNQNVTVTIEGDILLSGDVVFVFRGDSGNSLQEYYPPLATNQIDVQATSGGNIHFNMWAEAGDVLNYQITVPEPGTGAAVGALGALAALRRRRGEVSRSIAFGVK